MRIPIPLQPLYKNREDLNLFSIDFETTYNYQEGLAVKEAFVNLLELENYFFSTQEEIISNVSRTNSTLMSNGNSQNQSQDQSQSLSFSEYGGIDIEEMDLINSSFLDKITSTICYYNLINTNLHKNLSIFKVNIKQGDEVINIFKVYKRLWKLLFIGYHHCTKLSFENIKKCLLVIEAYSFASLLPDAIENRIINPEKFIYIIKLLKQLYEKIINCNKQFTISPLTTLKTEDIENNEEFIDNDIPKEEIPNLIQYILNLSLLCYYTIEKIKPLNKLINEYLELLGCYCSLEVPNIEPEVPIVEFSYELQLKILKNEEWLFIDNFMICMKWIHFNLTTLFNPNELNSKAQFKIRSYRATKFMQEIINYHRLSFSDLKLFLKHIITEFMDLADVKHGLAKNIALILNSMEPKLSQYIIENLFKDSLRASQPKVRSLTLEIYFNWLQIIFDSKLQDEFSKLLNYNLITKVDLIINLLESIALRFSDASIQVQVKALTNFNKFLSILKNQLKKKNENEENSLLTMVIKKVLQFVIIENQFNSLQTLTQREPYLVRKQAINNLLDLNQLFNLELTKEFGLDTQLIREYKLEFLNIIEIRCKDNNFRIRKQCIYIVVDLLIQKLINFKQINENNNNNNNNNNNINEMEFIKILFQLWKEKVLIGIFDTDKSISIEVLNLSQKLLVNYMDVLLYLNLFKKEFEGLSFKGLAKFINDCNNSKVAKPDQTNSIFNEAFFSILEKYNDRLIIDLGYGQFMKLYSLYWKLNEDLIDVYYNSLFNELIKLNINEEEQLIIGNQILILIYNWIHQPNNNEILIYLTKNLLKFQLPLNWVPISLQLLDKWKLIQYDWLSEDTDYFKYLNTIIQQCVNTFYQFISNNQQQQQQQESTNEGEINYKIELIGQILMIYPNNNQLDEIFDCLLILVGTLKVIEPKQYLLSEQVRNNIFISLGKLALIEEEYTAHLAPILAKEMTIEDSWVQLDNQGVYRVQANNNNVSLSCSIVVILSDLCLRYSRIIDPYIPIMVNNLRHFDLNVRKHTLICLIRLLRMDYLKFKKYLLFKMIVSYIMEKEKEIKEVYEFGFEQVLLIKDPNLFLNHLLDLIMFLNGKFESTLSNLENQLFVLNDNENPVHRRLRHKCYCFVLQYFKEGEKFIVSNLICNKLFLPIMQSELDLKDNKLNRIIEDALHILSSNEIIVHFTISNNQQDNFNNDLDGDEEKEKENIKLINQINIKNIIENIIPLLIQFQSYLQSNYSPLQSKLKLTLIKMILSFKVPMNNLKQILEPAMYNELELDIMKVKQKRLKNLMNNLTHHLKLGLYPDTPIIITKKSIIPQHQQLLDLVSKDRERENVIDDIFDNEMETLINPQEISEKKRMNNTAIDNQLSSDAQRELIERENESPVIENQLSNNIDNEILNNNNNAIIKNRLSFNQDNKRLHESVETKEEEGEIILKRKKQVNANKKQVEFNNVDEIQFENEMEELMLQIQQSKAQESRKRLTLDSDFSSDLEEIEINNKQQEEARNQDHFRETNTSISSSSSIQSKRKNPKRKAKFIDDTIDIKKFHPLIPNVSPFPKELEHEESEDENLSFTFLDL
ncbi:hypothetical protein K502DRAFT_347001 [Neoconidiobolus thromboides FSU 785]|nr:hypothetical protein K502DRAFT_347001 [Neoconidiobolus thromboides FSU 785]